MSDATGSHGRDFARQKPADSAHLAQVLSAAGMKKRQYAVVFLVLFALLLDGLDLQLLSFVAPLILDEWGVDPSDFGPTLSAALIGMTVGAPLGGWLGDRYGPRRVLFLSVVAFGMATSFAALTGDIVSLMLLRFLGGLGFGAATPNGVVLATEWAPPAHRPRIAAIMSMTTPLGGFAGAAAVGIMLPFVGWRGTFLICGIFTLLLAFVVRLGVPESPGFNIRNGKSSDARRDVRKMIRVSLPYDVATGPSESHAVSAIWTKDLARFNFAITTVFFSMAFVNFAFISWLPTLLESRGFALEDAIRGSLFYNLGAFIAALLASIVVRWTGTKYLLIFGSATTVVVLVSFGLLLSNLPPEISEDRVTIILTLCAALGFSTGTTGSTIFMLMATGYPDRCRATGVGYGVMVARLAGIITIISGGYLIDSAAGSLAPIFTILVAMGVIGFAGTYVVDRHIPRR